MKIIVDIMSGDKAPLEQLLGAYQAATENPETDMVFVGNEAIIRAIAAAKAGIEKIIANDFDTAMQICNSYHPED